MQNPFIEAFKECLLDAVNYSKNLVLVLKRGFLPGFHNGFMVALSGGPDSTAALTAMAELSKELDFRLGACHINHGLRGTESDEDERFCIELCRSFGIPLETMRVEHPDPAETAGDFAPLKSEAHLRQLRYQLLYDAAAKQQANYIVTGHTLDDQVETVLFRLFRGTSTSGLTAMQPARNIGDDRMLLRPMLYLQRKQCEEYLNSIAVRARHDSSNDQLDYTRNYLRNKVVPLIEDRFPGFKQRVEQLRRIVLAEDAHMNDEALDIFMELQETDEPDHWELAILHDEPMAIQRRLLAKGMQDRGIDVTYDRVETILEMIDTPAAEPAVSLNDEWDVRVTRDELIWLNKADEEEVMPDDFEIVLNIPGLNLVPPANSAIHAKPWKGSSGSEIEYPPADASEALVDLSSIKQPLVARRRRPGDLIQPFGMSKTIKLKRYLQTHKTSGFSAFERRHIIVIADQDEVIWIPGVGLSNKVKVSETPTHRLSWVTLNADDLNLA
jgi:tRNA(Ile)-lysidine synthase